MPYISIDLDYLDHNPHSLREKGLYVFPLHLDMVEKEATFLKKKINFYCPGTPD